MSISLKSTDVFMLLRKSLRSQCLYSQARFLKPNHPHSHTNKLGILISSHLCILEESSPPAFISLSYCWSDAHEPEEAYRALFSIAESQNHLWRGVWPQQYQYRAKHARPSLYSLGTPCILGENTSYWLLQLKCPFHLTISYLLGFLDFAGSPSGSPKKKIFFLINRLFFFFKEQF